MAKMMENAPENEGQPEFAVSQPELGSEGSGERVRLIGSKSGGLAALARLAGVPLSTLQRLAAGQEMKVDVMVRLARASGVRLEWLATGTGPMQSAEAGVFEAGGEMAGEDLQLMPPGNVLIPRYEARAAAGDGDLLDPGWIVAKVPFSADFIRTTLRRHPENLALIECAGDSMEPALHNGDELLVDTSARELRNGSIYILRVGGALLAKRVQPRMDGTVMILSDNPRYPPEVITPSEATPLDVVGEVLWRSGTLR